MADFFAPKPRAGRVAPEPGLGSIPEDAPDETLPRERSDDKLDSKEHVAEAVDAYVAAKSFRPALARAVASAARNVPELRDDVYDHVLTALRRTPSTAWSAAATAGAVGTRPISPTPLMPNGERGWGTSTSSTSIAGTSLARKMRSDRNVMLVG